VQMSQWVSLMRDAEPRQALLNGGLHAHDRLGDSTTLCLRSGPFYRSVAALR